MSKTEVRVIAAVCLMLAQPPWTVTSAVAQNAAGKANGRDLVERLCTNCHQLADGTNTKSGQMAPSFAQIASKAGQSRERIAGAIIIPHPAMPTVSLTMQEIRDVTTYIMSLKP